jgi:DNA-binding NarL/FixJ family response regulator
MFDDDDSVFAAMRAGARGYVLKGAEQHEIARAIAAVAAGEAIFGPAVATRVLTYFATHQPPRSRQICRHGRNLPYSQAERDAASALPELRLLWLARRARI